MSGIGGQGIQLASQVLAQGAVLAGLDVQLFGSYEGMMRGGATHATLIVAHGEVQSPPTVDRATAAIVMHHEHADRVIERVETSGLLFVNSSVCPPPQERDGVTVLALPATDVAVDVGHAMTATMVMAGAFAAATALMAPELLEQAVERALPPYRHAHIALNVAALRAGSQLVPEPVDTAVRA
jgi:Pyruvate/2-oxoacid:ferredoxin oxidoreductase gamma subunit